MIQVFAKAGSAVRISGYGEATETSGVYVPESVAAELESHPQLVVKRESMGKVFQVKPERAKPEETGKGEKG